MVKRNFRDHFRFTDSVLLDKQEPFDFLNECEPTEVMEWVLYRHLDLYCKENGYASWKREKQKVLKERLLEGL